MTEVFSALIFLQVSYIRFFTFSFNRDYFCIYVLGESVMLHLGEMIPKLKTRTQQKQSSEQQTTQSSSSTKKKGKGRR